MAIQYIELKEQGKPFWENWNGQQTFKFAAIGGIGGAGIGYVAYQIKRSEERKLPFNPNKYLYSVLNELNIHANPSALSKVLNIRDKITAFLYNKFENKLAAKPEYSGSFFKGTAINSNFDFDIVVPFSKDSFSSLEDMYETTYSEINDRYLNGQTEVRKQKRSIGVTFLVDELDYHFDIVPGREISNYKIDGELNLYVSPSNVFQSASSMKTNIKAHRLITVNRPNERKIIKLLKFYRDDNNLNFPSPVIQNMVVEAFDNRGHYSYSLYNNLLYTMEYISDKIHRKNLIDISNSNNNMMEKISLMERDEISNRLNKDLDRLEKDSRYLKEIFEI
jgi:hypothetical protein